MAYGIYQGRMRDAIHAFKYDRLHPAARNLGRLLAEAIYSLAGDSPDEMLVIPVPLHRGKGEQRGFNQAYLLARGALAAIRRTRPAWKLTLAAGILERSRATETQAGLTPRERRLNVRGAFRVADPSAVALKHVLLIDDILTTGATARAASTALMRAGAASVRVATLARARRVNWFPGSIWESAETVQQIEASSEIPRPVGAGPDDGVTPRLRHGKYDFDSMQPTSLQDRGSF